MLIMNPFANFRWFPRFQSGATAFGGWGLHFNWLWFQLCYHDENGSSQVFNCLNTHARNKRENASD